VFIGRIPASDGVDAMCSPRRTLLDKVLVDAARAAGVDAVVAGLGGTRPLGEALADYQRQRDHAAKPMYDFTVRLARIAPPSPAELALFQALSRRQEDADQFVGALTGAVPLREFMSPANIVRLVGVRGLAKLVLGQARRDRPAAGQSGVIPA
jgi:hypothetical protein